MTTPPSRPAEQTRSCWRYLTSWIKNSDDDSVEEAAAFESHIGPMNDSVMMRVDEALADQDQARDELNDILRTIFGGTTHRTEIFQRMESLAASNPSIFGERYNFCGNRDDLPAHIVVFVGFAYLNSIPTSTILKVLKAYPDAMHIPDSDGNLLIHRVCRSFWRRSDSRTILQYLVEHCPDSCFAKDVSNELPLHGLLVFRGLCVPETILAMVRSRPSFASTPDQNGNLPLQLILRKPTPIGSKWEEVIEALLEAHPEAVDDVHLLINTWFVDHSWELRMYIVARHLSRRRNIVHVGGGHDVDNDNATLPLSYTERFPLHAILYLHDARLYNFDTTLLPTSEGIQKYRHGCKHVDTYGRLALHVALTSGKGMLLKEIKRLMGWEPRAALIRDPITGLYPFMTMATWDLGVPDETYKHVNQLDLIYRMFRVECCCQVNSHPIKDERV